ncbi:MAG TPA: hypothetical protein VK451_01130, partial [Methyloceanibacter sp.]|nr:hypothetical protein [Methyloceanibacter sp.]
HMGGGVGGLGGGHVGGHVAGGGHFSGGTFHGNHFAGDFHAGHGPRFYAPFYDDYFGDYGYYASDCWSTEHVGSRWRRVWVCE